MVYGYCALFSKIWLTFAGDYGSSTCCSNYGQGYVPIVIRHVSCPSSSYSSLSSCSYTANSVGCSSSEAAGVQCYGKQFQELESNVVYKMQVELLPRVSVDSLDYGDHIIQDQLMKVFHYTVEVEHGEVFAVTPSTVILQN